MWLATLFFSAISQRAIFNIALEQHNIPLLKTTLLDISNPYSENYGNYLDVDYINNLVSPPDKHLVIDFFENNNITVLRDSGDSLKVFGETTIMSELFDIKEHNNNYQYTIPEQFNSFIKFIEGFKLYDYQVKPNNVIKTCSDEVDDRYVGQEVFYDLYNITDTCTCHTSSVASVEYGGMNGFSQKDIYQSQDLNNVSRTTVKNIIDNSPSSDTESQLDMQMMAINLGKNSDIWYWNNEQWLWSLAVDVFNHNNPPDILSMSYGWAEDNQCAITTCGNLTSEEYVDRVNNEYIKLGLRGISIVVASGDAGAPGRTSEDCDEERKLNPVFPGSSPWITSVGATYIKKSNKTVTRHSNLCKKYGCPDSKEQRVTTYDTVGWTSGGGVSKYSERISLFDKANLDYIHSGVSLPSNFSYTGRMYPDVSLIGHYCPVIDNGGLVAIDGTSCSTPLFAAIISKLNQYQLSRNRPKLGWINPILYEMYYQNSNSFNDIVEGYNWCTEFTCCGLNERNGSDYGFKATTGYDPVYGLGTPNVDNMKLWLLKNT